MSREEFIKTIAKMIVKEGKKRGYSVFSPVIAQAIIESRFGESGLATYNNFFGLKAGNYWNGPSVNMKTKEEYKPGTKVEIRDNFRVYSSMEDGVKGYYDFINTKRYANLKSCKTALSYCELIKADGYATSSTYVQTLMNCIITYKLYTYDGITEQIFNGACKSIREIAQEVVDGKWGNGQDRKNRLHAAGYDYATVQKMVNEILRG